MNKDVIYIDVEDDITAIIGKVKASSEKIVALVPPKRIGILQSSVNLRLLARAADNSSKRLVLITNSASLAGLAAASKIPIAKNLQSKPEIAEIPALAIDDGEDIIDGEKLPVGELIRTADIPVEPKAQTDIPVRQFQANDEQVTALGATAVSAKDIDSKKSKKAAGSKVPDFNKFRKKLVIFGGLGLLLVGFLVWAIVFAPRATIVIAAGTSEANVSGRATIGTGQATSFEAKTIRSITQEVKKDTTIDFTATGIEEHGEKATGTMTLTRNLGGSVRVPAGSSFSSGSYTFISNESVTVPAATFAPDSEDKIPGTIDVAVTATNLGSEYNLAARAYVSSVNGIAARGGQMSGGSKETVKIVTAEDVQQASEKLATQSNDTVKKELTGMFGSGVHVIDSSFVASPAAPLASPAVGEVATEGKAKLTSKVTYNLVGIAKNEIDGYLTQALQSQITDASQQQVYKTGEDSVTLAEYIAIDSTVGTLAVSASGQIGPKIDKEKVKQDARGQEYGAVQQSLESIKGIDSVDVKFWPFWVRTVPNNVERILVEFKLESDGK